MKFSIKHLLPRIGSILIAVGLATPGFAEPATDGTPAPRLSTTEESLILFPPSKVEMYSGNVTPETGWLMRLHGIRNGPLHPLVWGTRKDQRTESARIIPIKRYYLRSSEQPSYRIDHLVLDFSFWRTSKGQMLASPHDMDPILEIEFCGEIVMSTSADLASVDRGYDLRLSAFIDVPSGLFFRSHILSSLVYPFKNPILKTQKEYRLEGFFTDTKARFLLNGNPLAEASAPQINKGFVSLISSWRPTSIKKIEIDGHLVNNSNNQLHESGLVILVNKKAGSTSAEPPAPTDNNELDKALLRPVEEQG